MSFLRVLPDVLLLGLIYSFLYKKTTKHDKHAILVNSILFMSLGLIMLVTLSPVLLSIKNIFIYHPRTYNFELFVDWTHKYGNYITDTVLNIILFIPFSLTLALATKKKPLSIILSGILLSLFIETIQPLLSTARIGDITDVFNNSLGTIIGTLLSLFFIKKN